MVCCRILDGVVAYIEKAFNFSWIIIHWYFTDIVNRSIQSFIENKINIAGNNIFLSRNEFQQKNVQKRNIFGLPWQNNPCFWMISSGKISSDLNKMCTLLRLNSLYLSGYFDEHNVFFMIVHVIYTSILYTFILSAYGDLSE